MKSIFIIGETTGEKIDRLTMEVLGFADQLGKADGWSVRLVLMGATEEEASAAAAESGVDIMLLADAHLSRYTAESWIAALRDLYLLYRPDIIAVPGTSRGFDYAPALSIGIQSRYIPGVIRCRPGEDSLVFTRQYWFGKLEMDVAWQGEPLVLTCQAGSFAPHAADGAVRGSMEIITVNDAPGTTVPLGIESAESMEGADLREAEIVISAGRGMGSRENCELLRQLAQRFPRSALGASRPVCDYGWHPYSRQIGQTGKTVSPKLYIACGISGSLQHIAGMKGSDHIVAINTDPDAPIFRYAHAGIVADCPSFIRSFLDYLDGLK